MGHWSGISLFHNIAHWGASAHAPDLLTSVLFHDPNLDPHSLVQGVKCDFLHPCFDIFENPLKYFTSKGVDRLRNTGAGLIGWNITTAEMADTILG